MRQFLALLLLLLTVGCAAKAPPLPITPPQRARLFPDGIYRQRVNLQIHPNAAQSKRTFAFTAILALKPQSIQLTGLSPFMTTLFTMDEDLATGRIEKRVYLDDLRPYTVQMDHYYGILRPLFLASPQAMDFSAADSLGIPLRIAEPIEVRLSYFDSRQQIPRRLEIRHSDFNIEVRIEKYQP